jgi:hypothetical protein
MLLNVGGECPETPHRNAPKHLKRKSLAILEFANSISIPESTLMIESCGCG